MLLSLTILLLVLLLHLSANSVLDCEALVIRIDCGSLEVPLPCVWGGLYMDTLGVHELRGRRHRRSC